MFISSRQNMKFCCARIAVAFGVLAFCGTAAHAAILGQHSFTWWDDGVACNVTPFGAQPPTLASVPLFHVNEWHLDQLSTTNWYNGGAVPRPPGQPV